MVCDGSFCAAFFSVYLADGCPSFSWDRVASSWYSAFSLYSIPILHSGNICLWLICTELLLLYPSVWETIHVFSQQLYLFRVLFHRYHLYCKELAGSQNPVLKTRSRIKIALQMMTLWLQWLQAVIGISTSLDFLGASESCVTLRDKSGPDIWLN